MASVKEMRTRIASVKSTQKITKAMQMVAAAKLRRAQAAAESARPYASSMAGAIANLAAGVSGSSAPLLLKGTGKDRRHLMVVATADRGLAGGFNAAIVRTAREKIASLLAEGREVKIIAIGRKARDQFRRHHPTRLIEVYEAGIGTANFALVKPMAQKILDLYGAAEFDVVSLVHSHFKSVVVQQPVFKQLIPAVVENVGPTSFYDYEPDQDTILEALLPQNISVQLLSALLENQAGFFAAQMAAMDNATRNAGDLINALTIRMNRTRQAQITKELIEIISGAEAL
ncbi:MAG: F0F1 ATP synthase subunit gamma [Rhizomicrobium sp.]